MYIMYFSLSAVNFARRLSKSFQERNKGSQLVTFKNYYNLDVVTLWRSLQQLNSFPTVGFKMSLCTYMITSS